MSAPVFNADYRSRTRVFEVPGKNWIDWMVKSHYLGKWPGVVVLRLVMAYDERPVGFCIFALPPRETAKRYGGVTWELARLWISDDMPKNAETFLIAKAVKFVRRHRPDVEFLVSYADPAAGHTGTIYKAANWIADGRTDMERKSPRCDYVDTRTGTRYSRKAHVPTDAIIARVPRSSKPRFIYKLKSAAVAQLAERGASNAEVTSSTLVCRSIQLQPSPSRRST